MHTKSSFLPANQHQPASIAPTPEIRRVGLLAFHAFIVVLAVGVTAMLAGCGGGGSKGGGTTSGTNSSNSVSVPNVVDDTVAAATSALQAAGLTLGTQTAASSATVPSGEIISQDPAAGTIANSGSTVTVVVSSGPASVNVPNVVDDTVAEATSALEAAGLTLGNQTTAASSTVPSGEIISQNPAAGTSVASGTAVAVVVSSGPASAPVTETVLHSFGSGSDGQNPQARLIQGSDGNFYGTTYSGGTNSAGTVFKITPAGVETVLYSFGSSASGDGNYPEASLIQGSDGNFYGTTVGGGTKGYGTVFKITPAGVETVLHSFVGGSGDGTIPTAGVIQGSDGNFYGTTHGGGANGNGTVFEITPAGAETVLYSFRANGEGDGLEPASLIQGSDGNFYGTTSTDPQGVTKQELYGTVFEITPAGVETVLYTFGGSNVNDGDNPNSLIEGSDGNFYGTTSEGGTKNIGTAFKVTPAGAETVLHSFVGGSGDGQTPLYSLIQGSDGNFYDTTFSGGTNNKGTLFEITPAGVETVLYSFGSGSDGANPDAGVIEGSDGNFYGTTDLGGANGEGTVFKIVP